MSESQDVVKKIRKATRRKFSAKEKIRILIEVLRAVECSGLPVKDATPHFNVTVRAYYTWRKNFRDNGFAGLHDRSSFRSATWNELRRNETDK